MAFVAQLYQDYRHVAVRQAERYPVSLDGTLRNPRAEPHDVTIEDLSATGFRTAQMTGIEIGDVVTLGIFGVGLRSAAVMRNDKGSYGCQFLVPLTAGELRVALAGVSPPEPVPLRIDPFTRGDGAQTTTEWSLSPRMRLTTIVAAGTLPWVMFGLAWRLL